MLILRYGSPSEAAEMRDFFEKVRQMERELHTKYHPKACANCKSNCWECEVPTRPME